ncbi:MAG: hypothetical protein ACFHU9_09620 [Fluviicola sp.]
MKTILFSLLIISGFSTSAFASLIIKGKYQGKNLYVQNPYDSETNTFCVTGVLVNGQKVATEIGSTAFEIKLSNLGFDMGDQIIIQIDHRDGCKPVVLGNGLTQVNRAIRIEPASLTNGVLRWKHHSELHSYEIEQYRWNKWINVDVNIDDLDAEGYYSTMLNNDLHSGTNTFRIIAQNENGTNAYSNNLTAESGLEPVSYEMRKNERLLTFSSETQFELYDAMGEQILTGKSIELDLSGLSSGVYYLNFDNYNSKIEVK